MKNQFTQLIAKISEHTKKDTPLGSAFRFRIGAVGEI